MDAHAPEAVLQRDAVTATSHYCEENVALLCKHVLTSEASQQQWYAVLISNEAKSVPIWHQSQALAQGQDPETQPVVWDYHVVLLQRSRNAAWIYDYDTLLGWPCPAKAYAVQSFRPELRLRDRFAQRFRVMPAEEYVGHFASDRSHMLNAEGAYHKPPPSHAALRGGFDDHGATLRQRRCLHLLVFIHCMLSAGAKASSAMTLPALLNMGVAAAADISEYGAVVDVDTFISSYCCPLH